VDRGRRIFYAENQGVDRWSTLSGGEDPPVFGRYEGKEQWADEKIKLSEHLILACLFDAVMCHAKYKASVAWLDARQLAQFIETIPPLAIGPWLMDGLALLCPPRRLPMRSGERHRGLLSLGRREDRAPAAISQAIFE
jgi:hypothetical protein